MLASGSLPYDCVMVSSSCEPWKIWANVLLTIGFGGFFAVSLWSFSYEASGDSVKVTTDGTDGDGKPSHSEWTGKFDGKDYPVTGDPSTDTRSYKTVDDHTLTFANKKGDKVTISGRGVVSADGKTRTVTITGTDPKGTKFTSTAVYDKQ